MRQPLHFWVVGGDPRCLALAQALVGDGHTVHTYGTKSRLSLQHFKQH